MDRSIIYLCRGHGYGHASRARLILPALQALAGGPHRVELASAGAGVDYLRMYGITCVDLGIADTEDHSVRAGERIFDYLRGGDKPAVVFSDDLFFVPRMCAGLGIPCVLMMCSFYLTQGKPQVGVFLGSADHIVLPDWPEVEPIPSRLSHKVTAIGPIVPDITVDRQSARAALGIPESAFVATLALGRMYSVKSGILRQAASVVVQAWSRAPAGSRLLLLFDEREAEQTLGAVPQGPGISLVGRSNQASTYYRASDVVFSVGGSTTNELVKNAIPTVAVCAKQSDERRRVEFLSHHAAVTVADGDEAAEELWALVHAAIERGTNPAQDLRWGSPAEIAGFLAPYLS
ncbi:hypothetical protein [Actinopolymorpha alba]|uniref:hypothetical protein n=1 Tax=Actinopolymorpha alba TaxID=533267 RepID=UPI000368618F|nr:hypothetical protein [Actinopolymorpha alba]